MRILDNDIWCVGDSARSVIVQKLSKYFVVVLFNIIVLHRYISHLLLCLFGKVHVTDQLHAYCDFAERMESVSEFRGYSVFNEIVCNHGAVSKYIVNEFDKQIEHCNIVRDSTSKSMRDMDNEFQ